MNDTDQIGICSKRLVILQRVCPKYRIALFQELTMAFGENLMLYIGEDIPNSKVKSYSELNGIRYQKLKTRMIYLGNRVLPWHLGLIGRLRTFRPDVILCEADSHFLGYIQAILYKTIFNKNVALLHWCYIDIPGLPAITPSPVREFIKDCFRPFFSAFVVYSSYGKRALLKLKVPVSKIFVATNVGDTEELLHKSNTLNLSSLEAKRQLNLPNRFTVIYVGELDPNKRSDLIVDIAQKCDDKLFNFVLLGSGTMLEPLRERILLNGMTNVFLPGRVADDLFIYYRAADALIIPGRGGIVISEGMAFELPVIVFQADGTECDLVQNKITGIQLDGCDVEDFKNAIVYLYNNPDHCREMGLNGKWLINNKYNTKNMSSVIRDAVTFVTSSSVGRSK